MLLDTRFAIARMGADISHVVLSRSRFPVTAAPEELPCTSNPTPWFFSITQRVIVGSASSASTPKPSGSPPNRTMQLSSVVDASSVTPSKRRFCHWFGAPVLGDALFRLEIPARE